MASTLERAAIDYVKSRKTSSHPAIQDDEQDRVLQQLIDAVQEREEDLANEGYEDALRRAREMYGDAGSCEIDDGAAVSFGEDGPWVQAWIFAPSW